MTTSLFYDRVSTEPATAPRPLIPSLLHGLLSPWYGPPSYETASHCGASAMIVYLQKGPIRAKHHGIADTLDRTATRARARRRGGVHGRR